MAPVSVHTARRNRARIAVNRATIEVRDLEERGRRMVPEELFYREKLPSVGGTSI